MHASLVATWLFMTNSGWGNKGQVALRRGLEEEMKPNTETAHAKFVSDYKLSSDYMQFCAVMIFMAMDRLSEMSNQGGCQAVPLDQEPNCFSTVHHLVVLLLKNGAPTPALRGLFDVPAELHRLKKAQNYISEIVIRSFQAQPCVSLPDNSSLFKYGEPSSRVPLSCFLGTLSSGALLFLEQKRSTSKFVIICFLTYALILALERRDFSHLSVLFSLFHCRPFLLGWI